MKRFANFIAVMLFGFALFGPQHTLSAGNCLNAIDAAGCSYGLPIDEYNALLPQMLANPTPPMQTLPTASDDILRYSVVGKNGKVLDAASSFSGTMVSGGFPFQAAWVLRTTYPSQLPGGAPDKTIAARERYGLVYLFATVKYRGLPWYLVGPGQWLPMSAVAKIKPASKPEGVTVRWVAVDLREQVLTVYEGESLVFTTLISSGVKSYNTRTGLFKIWIHLATDDMNGSMGQPDQYSLPYVPYVMYFDRSIALHGAYWHDGFGYPRSHGCVNLSLTDSRWLFEWTANTPNTSVFVWRSA
jgi:hypothetical protein